MLIGNLSDVVAMVVKVPLSDHTVEPPRDKMSNALVDCRRITGESHIAIGRITHRIAVRGGAEGTIQGLVPLHRRFHGGKVLVDCLLFRQVIFEITEFLDPVENVRAIGHRAIRISHRTRLRVFLELAMIVNTPADV